MGNKILKKNNLITFESLDKISGIENIKEINIEPIKQALIETCLKSYILEENNRKNVFLEKFKNILKIPKKKNDEIENILLINTNLPTINIKTINSYLNFIDFDINIHCVNFHSISNDNSNTHQVLLMIQIPQLKYNKREKGCRKLNSKKTNCFTLLAKLYVSIDDHMNVKLKYDSLILINPLNCNCEYNNIRNHYVMYDELFHRIHPTDSLRNWSFEKVFFDAFFRKFLNVFKSLN
jgi:hypothetical protein